MWAMRYCDHPHHQRWHGRSVWRCCSCGRHFWSTDQHGTVDIYGRVSLPAPKPTPPARA